MKLKQMMAVVAVMLVAAMTASSDETQMVEARGVGTDKEEALKDAYRDAVEQAVGMYVYAEQQMKNEELVNDQILTQSNAYIEKYEVVKERKKANGLFEIQIKAEVKKSALTKKLRDVVPKQTFALGDDAQNIHSRVVTKEKRNVDAAALLENVLKDVNPIKQFVQFSPSDVKPQRKKYVKHGAPGGELAYFRFRVEFDEHKYFKEFLPNFMEVLGQIALEQPKTIYLTKKPDDSARKSKRSSDRDKYLLGDYEEDRAYWPQSLQSTLGNAYINTDVLMDGLPIGIVELVNDSFDIGRDLNIGQRGHAGNILLNKDIIDNGDAPEFYAVVITKMNASRSNVQAKRYKLPTECAAVMCKWQDDVRGGKSGRNIGEKKTTWNVTFCNKDGEEVAAFPVSYRNSSLVNFVVTNTRGKVFGDQEQRHHRNKYGKFGLYMTPMISMIAKSRERWIGFDIPLDELPNIKSVTVELAE